MREIKFSYIRIYLYKGWHFEWHRNKPFGPWPCKKDWEPRARAGDKFWNMFQEFSELSDDEQEQYRVF